MIENNFNFINGFNEKEFIDSSVTSCDARFYKCPKCGSYHIVRNVSISPHLNHHVN